MQPNNETHPRYLTRFLLFPPEERKKQRAFQAPITKMEEGYTPKRYTADIEGTKDEFCLLASNMREGAFFSFLPFKRREVYYLPTVV